MVRTIGVLLFGCGVAIAAAIGCSAADSDGAGPSQEEAGAQSNQGARPGETTGTVTARLTLPGGEHIGIASYSMTDGTNLYAGPIDVSGTATLSFTIGSVVAGTGYTLMLNATTDDGAVTCTASAGPITVVSRTTTTVSVAMACTSIAGRDAGSALFNVIASNCPVWNTIVANPLNVTLEAGANVDDAGSAGSTGFFQGGTSVPADIAVGDSLVLVASATAPNPGLMSFLWTTTGGSLTSTTGTIDPNGDDAGTTDQTTFTCTSAGSVTVTLVVSDGPLPEGGGCDSHFTTGSITVNCQVPATTDS